MTTFRPIMLAALLGAVSIAFADPQDKPAEPDRPAAPAQALPQPPDPAAKTTDVYVRGKRPAKAVLKSVEPGKRKVCVLVVDGMVDPGLHEWITRTTREALDDGATHIIYEIDTYGGLIKSAIDIVDYITRDVNPRAHTIAYIPEKAISAGVMISLACRDIVVGPHAKIGDSAPMSGNGEAIAEIEREKIETMVRASFRSMAQANGWPEALCEAMVTRTTSAVFRVWNRKENRYEFIKQPDLPAESADLDLAGKTRVVGERELLTMTGDEAYRLGFAEAVIAEADNDALSRLRIKLRELELEQNVEAETELKTKMGALVAEAIRPVLDHYGIPGKPQVRIAPAREFFGAAMARTKMNHPIAIIFILAVGIIGLMIGIKTGEAQALLIGLGALALFFYTKYDSGTAEVWEIALAVAGLACVVMEILFVPTAGALLIGGAVAFFGGVLLCFLPGFELGGILPSGSDSGGPSMSFRFPWAELTAALLTMSAGFSLGTAGTWLVLQYLHKIPFLGRTVLAMSETETGGPGAGAPLSRAVAIGQTGRVEMALRPVGKARFGDRLVDVVAQGEFLDPGVRVQVFSNDGNRIMVRKVD